MIPPGCTKSWDDLNVWAEAMLVAYNQIRENEEYDLLKASLGMRI